MRRGIEHLSLFSSEWIATKLGFSLNYRLIKKKLSFEFTSLFKFNLILIYLKKYASWY